MIDWAKTFGRRFLAVTLFMGRHVQFVDLKIFNGEGALTIASSLLTIFSPWQPGILS
jgi:hypothetical protein